MMKYFVILGAESVHFSVEGGISGNIQDLKSVAGKKASHCHQHVPSALKLSCCRMVFIDLFIQERLFGNSAAYLINKQTLR